MRQSKTFTGVIEMNDLLNWGWHECSNGQWNFHSYNFDVMKMIVHLIDHVDMLKNQCGYSTLWVIVPECVPSDETLLNNDKEEDEYDAKV